MALEVYLVMAWKVEANAAYLCAPDSKCNSTTSTISNLLSKQSRIRVLLFLLVHKPEEKRSFHTIIRPLIPIIKSNQGSIPSSGDLLRSTWKPKAPWVEFWAGESESSRDIKRLRALNIFLASKSNQNA